MVELFSMIAVISGGLICYGIVLGRREGRERVVREHLDPDAHLGRCGTE
jgi:hypothetical protein